MKIEVACRCGKRYAARKSLAGKTVKCPKCGARLVVPELPSKRSAEKTIRADPPCPSCRGPMPLGAVVCLECGYNRSLGRRMETKRVRADTRADKGYVWILAAIAFVAFAIWLVGPVVLWLVAAIFVLGLLAKTSELGLWRRRGLFFGGWGGCGGGCGGACGGGCGGCGGCGG